jgi:pilus assembly protein CpaB
MRLSTALMFVVAIVLGAAAVILTRTWLESQVRGPIVMTKDAPGMTTIVVAARPLRYGMELAETDLKEVPWQMNAVPTGTFRNKAELVNGKERRSVLSSIEANEPILEWKITGPGQRASLSALIQEGMTAVTLQVNEILGVAGFVLPGDRVNVLLTRSDNERGEYTDVLMQNVKVLAVNQLADDKAEKPVVAKAVTLEVSMQDAQKLVLAANVGRISLTLRQAGGGPGDITRRVTTTDLGLGSAPLLATIAPEQPKKDDIVPKRDPFSIIGVYRDLKRSEYPVRQPRAER